MTRIIARRLGRIAFGLVLLVGFVELVRALIAWDHLGRVEASEQLLATIGATWLAAILAGAAGWAIGRSERVASRIAAAGPEKLFTASALVPTAGIALLLPITLQMPFVVLLCGLEWVDAWIAVGLLVTSLTHVVFAGLCMRRAHQLVTGKPAITPGKVYLTTVLVSCVPFVVMYAIPPALVALTALPFIPMLWGMEKLIARERAELAGIASLPRAIAVARQRL